LDRDWGAAADEDGAFAKADADADGIPPWTRPPIFVRR
jgi:hypothetical protein